MFYLNFRFHCIILSVLKYGIKKEEKEKGKQNTTKRGPLREVQACEILPTGAEYLFFMYVWAWKAHLRCPAPPFPLKVKVIVIQMVPLTLIWKDG